MKELEEPNVQNLTKLGNQKSSRFIKQFLAKNGLERLIDQLNSFQEIGMYHKTIENLMILGVNAIENIFLEKQGARYFLHQIRGTGASVTGFCRFVQGTTPVVRAEIYSTLEKKIRNCVRLVSSIGLRGAVTPPHLWEDWPYFLDKVVLKSMLAANSGQVRDIFW